MNDTEKTHSMKIMGIDISDMIGIERQAENTTNTEDINMKKFFFLSFKNSEKEAPKKIDIEN